jgi:hypothetical protein
MVYTVIPSISAFLLDIGVEPIPLPTFNPLNVCTIRHPPVAFSHRRSDCSGETWSPAIDLPFFEFRRSRQSLDLVTRQWPLARDAVLSTWHEINLVPNALVMRQGTWYFPLEIRL